ncbi:MAG: DUF2892 domain-containing protein [Dehalococcoidia bacterium]
MQALIQFMNGPIGRGARITVGLALIYLGMALLGGVAGTIVAGLGVVAIALGASGRCLAEALPGAR